MEQTAQGWLAAADFGTIAAALRRSFAAAVAALADTSNASKPADRAPYFDDAEAAVEDPVTDDDERRTRVWLVEDDALLGETLVRLLGQFGYDVRLFTRLDAAEAAVSAERPDILVMDVVFAAEGVNATEALLERLAFKAMNCPLLFVSAHGDFESRVRAARLGAEGYLLKPIDVPRLVDRLERTLEARFAVPSRVLIVDDDVALSEHFRLVLTATGMDVAMLNQPEAVIETVSAFHPELILMDMHMPGYSGPELATVIRHYDE